MTQAYVRRTHSTVLFLGPAKVGFVHIDASHAYRDVKADINAWWPTILSGGILAGHDWNFNSVKRAVKEFAKEIDATINLTLDPTPSWYIYKKED